MGVKEVPLYVIWLDRNLRRSCYPSHRRPSCFSHSGCESQVHPLLVSAPLMPPTGAVRPCEAATSVSRRAAQPVGSPEWMSRPTARPGNAPIAFATSAGALSLHP